MAEREERNAGPMEVIGMYHAAVGETARLRADRDDLLRSLERLLVAVEPILWALVQDIDRQVEAKQEWARHYNATCGNSNEMWFYSSEFRRALESELLPFTDAIRDGNATYDRIVPPNVSAAV